MLVIISNMALMLVISVNMVAMLVIRVNMDRESSYSITINQFTFNCLSQHDDSLSLPISGYGSKQTDAKTLRKHIGVNAPSLWFNSLRLIAVNYDLRICG